jgi:hypothetical protein
MQNNLQNPPNNDDNSWLNLSLRLGASLLVPVAVPLTMIGSGLCYLVNIVFWLIGNRDWQSVPEKWSFDLFECSEDLLNFMFRSSYNFFAKLFKDLFDIVVKISLGFYLTFLKPIINTPYLSLGIISSLVGGLLVGLCSLAPSFTTDLLVPMASIMGLASSSLGIPIAIAMYSLIIGALTSGFKFLYDQGADHLLEPGGI